MRLRFARVVASKKSAFFVVWRLLLFIFASPRCAERHSFEERDLLERERNDSVRIKSIRVFLSLFFLTTTTTTTMMMTNTRCDAWLPSIELGTGVVIGQHFRARCAETFANNSESSRASEGRKRERERKGESARVSA